MKYDYLIVGSGLYGATFAYMARQAGKRCLVIDRRHQLGGNVYCEQIEGINVHKYGAHIFHTSNKEVWDFVNSLVPFNRYTNSPVANYKGELYNLPFNMNTFNRLWGVKTPAEAKAKVDEQVKESVETINKQHAAIGQPPLTPSPTGGGWEGASNLEEQALCLVGRDIYEKLIKEYTEKQWGRNCSELPAFIIRRLPVRMVFDNNYFNDKYQGIPVGGYNKLIEKLLAAPPQPSPVGRESCADEVPLLGGFRGADCLVGIDLPLNPGKKVRDLANGGYRETAAAENYEILKDNAKRMRKEPTEAEKAFWEMASSGFFGAKFRRQHIIGNNIADFVCLEKRLVVEIDGGYHDEEDQQIKDQIRSEELKDFGFSILRLKNEEVIGNPEEVKRKVTLALWLAEKVPLRGGFRGAADTLVFTGQLDEYFDYSLGRLDWRTVSFKTRVEDTPNYQGNAVVNYTSHDEPYTRVIEHKHFEMFGQEVYDCSKTVVSEEYSTEYKALPQPSPVGRESCADEVPLRGGFRGAGAEPFYPVNDERNNTLADAYRQLAGKEKDVIFGGRLAEYKYYDMAPIIEKVLNLWRR